VLKALQDACQRQRIPLALSLALQLRTEHVIETAITVANHFGRAVVAEALDTILAHKRALAAALLAQQQGPVYHDGPAYSSSEYAHEEDNHYQDAPSFDAESSPVPNRNVTFAEETNTLSNKLSRTMPPLSTKPSIAQVVSPTLTGSAEKEKAPARNPFAVVSSGTTPQKRKNVFDGIQDMKASPSPKKPTLNVSILVDDELWAGYLFNEPQYSRISTYSLYLFLLFLAAPRQLLPAGTPATPQRQAHLVRCCLEKGVVCLQKGTFVFSDVVFIGV